MSCRSVNGASDKEYCGSAIDMKSSPSKYRPDELVFDGKGYVTPLQSGTISILDFVDRDIASLPRQPQYPSAVKVRERRSAPSATDSRGNHSLLFGTLLWIILLFTVGALLLWSLFLAHQIVTPELPPLPTGVVPFGPITLLSFSIYAVGGLTAGVFFALWWLRSSQN